MTKRYQSSKFRPGKVILSFCVAALALVVMNKLDINEEPSLRRASRQTYFPFIFIIAALAAGAVGSLMFLWRSDKTQFSQSDEFHAWVAVVAFLLILLVAVATWSWLPFRRIRREAGRTEFTLALVLYAIIWTLAAVSPAKLAGSLPIPEYEFYPRVWVLALLIFIAAMPPFCGLILLGSVLRRQNIARTIEHVHSREAIGQLLAARSELRQYLWGAISIIAGLMITVGCLQAALSTYSEDNSAVPTLSAVGLLLYGTFFAVLLALVSMPAYAAWQRQAQMFRDHLYPIPERGLNSDWYTARSNLEDLLQMRIGAGQRFLAILGILAPLAISIVSAFIPAIH